MEGNGKNRFHIIIKCPYSVFDDEWAELLFLINNLFQKHEGGKFINIEAHLEE